MNVGQLCTRDVVTIPRTARIVDAARLMRDRHVGGLLVTEKDERGHVTPVGVLTDRDIVVALLAKDVDHVKTLDVGDVMTSELVTATEDEGVGEVLRRMRSFGVRRVPVVSAGGTLVGIATLDDFLTCVSDELAEMAFLVSRQRCSEKHRRP